MTALLLVIASIAVGAASGKWWVLTLPLLAISLFAGAHAALGPSWGADTPVVAIAVVTEAALMVGVLVRRRFPRVA
jgi:hypothetical protein